MLLEPLSTNRIGELCDFLRSHYPEHVAFASEQFCTWRYLQNPLGPSLNDCLVVRQDGRVVGFLGAIRDRLWDGTEWHDCRWLVNLMIAPDVRGGLEVLRMFQKNMDQHELLLSTGVGQQMLPLYQTLGWQQLSVVDTFYCVRRPAALWRLAKDKGRAGVDLATLLRPLDWIVPRWKSKRVSSQRHSECECHLEPTSARLHEFLRAHCTQLGVTTWRDPDLLEWRLQMGANQLWLAKRRDDTVMGYALVKTMHREKIACWLEVVDLVANTQDAACSLLESLDRQADEGDVDFTRIRTSNDVVKNLLQKYRWWKKTMPVSDDIFCFARDAQVSERITTGPWYFTSLVSDRS